MSESSPQSPNSSSSPMLAKSAVHLSIPPNMQLRPEQLSLSKQLLGQGGFAKVMQADFTPSKNENNKFPVAVKVMNKGQVSRSTFCSLQNEIDICATLRHPCLINTLGILEDVDCIYIVMDLAEGGEMFKYTQKFGLEDMPIVAPNFVGEVVLGLEYMKTQGVVHRDIKPENLLLTSEYHVKISDFGTVCRVDDAAANRFTGTPFYVSPEMLSNGQASVASDLWALGCVVYQLFVGRPPFQGESQYLVMQSIKERHLEFPPYFPSDAKSLVDRLLDPNPATRLGNGPLGFAELKNHPFFKTVNWETILSQPNITHLNANYTKQWEAFLLKNERVIYASKIVKERYQLLPTSAKERMLILTDYPRLFYLEPGSLVIKGQVPWSDKIFAQSDSQERFTVVTPDRKYIFVDSEQRAPLWTAKINDLVKRRK